MKPKDAVTKWNTQLEDGQKSAPEPPNAAQEPPPPPSTLYPPDLAPSASAAPPRPDVEPGDEVGQALADLEPLDEVLRFVTGRAYLLPLNAAWAIYEQSGQINEFQDVVQRLQEFHLRVRKAQRMVEVFGLNSDPRAEELAQGLQERALEDREVRRKWEDRVDLYWGFFLRDAGPFRGEIIQEFS